MKYIIIAIVFVFVLLFVYLYMSSRKNQPSEPNVLMKERRERFDNKKGEIVLYFSDSCIHCRNFMPVWNEFEKFAQINLQGLTVKKVACDGDGQQVCIDRQINAFPTVIMYPVNGRIEGVPFEKNRTVNDLVKFVNENSQA